MSQKNVDLARRTIDAFNRRDLDAFLALMDDDIEIASRIVAIEGGLRGHDGVRRWWQNWLDTWPDYRAEVVEMRDHGDVTIAATRALGHGAGSEVPFEDAAWQVCRWRAGKLAAWSIFTDEDQALEAVGLSKQDAHADS